MNIILDALNKVEQEAAKLALPNPWMLTKDWPDNAMKLAELMEGLAQALHMMYKELHPDWDAMVPHTSIPSKHPHEGSDGAHSFDNYGLTVSDLGGRE